MRRRDFMSTLGGLAAIWPVAARARQKERVHRIVYLSAPSRELVQRTLDAFLRKLREHSWVEGENFITRSDLIQRGSCCDVIFDSFNPNGPSQTGIPPSITRSHGKMLM